MKQVRPYEDPTHFYRKAVYFQKQNKHGLAIREFQNATAVDPTRVEAYNGMGVSYDNLGDFENAAAAYEEALRINPDLDYIWNNLGYSYLLQGDYDSAVKTFQKALELYPGSRLYHNNLGLAYAKKGSFDMALSEFRKAGGEEVARNNLAKIMTGGSAPGQEKVLAAKLVPESVGQAGSEIASGEQYIQKVSLVQEKSYPKSIVSPMPLTVYKSSSAPELRPVWVDDNPVKPAYMPETGDPLHHQGTAGGMPILPKVELASISHPMRELPGPNAPDPKNMFVFPAVEDRRPVPDDSQTHGGLTVEIISSGEMSFFAQRLRNDLLAAGFEVECIDQAAPQVTRETRVHYCAGFLQDAFKVVKIVPGYQNMDRFATISGTDRKIRILLGRDMLCYRTAVRMRAGKKS